MTSTIKTLILIIILAIIITIPGCLPPAENCPQCTDFKMTFTDSSGNQLQIDSLHFTTIKNLETDSVLYTIWSFGNLFGYSPDYITLYLFTQANQSTFLFTYPNQPDDTIIYKHHYIEEYNKGCGSYYLQATECYLAKCTFKNYSLTSNGNLCPDDINIQF
jgi:hypothetical protein